MIDPMAPAMARLRGDVGWRRVDPARRPVLFINPRSGDGTAGRVSLAERARELGIEPVILSPGHDLAEVAESAVSGGADVLGMAGGDGSLAVVAAAALAHGLPFVCVPAGTRNHFALDVGILRHDVVGALAAFTDALERRIDVAQVNGRLFLNNVSLGIYGEAVRQPRYRDEKLRTLLDTARSVLGPAGPVQDMDLADDEGRVHHDPAAVLVSNNPYALARGSATRPRLDTGRLGVVVLERPAARPQRPDHAWTAPSLTVDAPATVNAGLDGEAISLAPPLRFETRHLALRVRISSRHPGVSPSGLVGPAGGR
jgi:diacylglycerol kinase family enzyme